MEKCLFVVGASSDMGMAAIRSLADDYDLVVAHYRTMNERLEDCASTLGEKLLLLQADLEQEQALREMLGQMTQRGIVPTHILHFPAPLCNNKHFHKIKWDVFQKELDISLRSFILVCQAFLPLMAKRGGGRVVTILSNVINGVPPKHCANYIVTKYALHGAVKALAAEYADKGITVNGVSPGWVQTKYLSSQPDFLVQQNAAASPLRRNLELGDVIPSIVFLLSDGASCINGQNITVSFGR